MPISSLFLKVMKSHNTRRFTIRPEGKEPRKVSAELMVPEATQTTAIAIRNFFGAGPAHLNLPETLTFDEFIAFAPQLSRIDATVQWWIGDYLNYAQRRFKLRFREVIDRLNLNNGKPYGDKAIEAAQRVAKSIPSSERDLRLTWNHYVALAKFKDRDERRHWARRAIEEELSTRALKLKIGEDARGRQAPKASSRIKSLDRFNNDRLLMKVETMDKAFFEAYSTIRLQWNDNRTFERSVIRGPATELRDTLTEFINSLDPTPRRKKVEAYRSDEARAV